MKKRLFVILVGLVMTSLAFGQVSSVQDGDWNNPLTWDCGCVPDLNEATITVSNNVSVTADVTIDETVITAGGSLIINSGVVVTLNEDFVSSPLTIEAGRTLTVNGTLDGSGLIISGVIVDGSIINSGVISILDPSLMFFGSGANYTHSHATGGDIPMATWDAASSVLVNGMNNASPLPPNNVNQSFGNFTWNCPTQGTNTTFNFGGQLTSIQGTLTFQSSNNKPIRFNHLGSGYNLTIGGDFINQGSPLILASSSSGATTTVTVARDFIQSGGSLTFKASNGFDVRLEVGRNFSKTVGAFAGGTGAGVSTLSFNGGVTQSYTLSGTNPATINIEVINNSTLNMGTSFFTGLNFSLGSGSTLRVGATDASGAIQTGTTSGNIRVSGTRTFNSGSTVVYNGSAAQFMGNGHPSSAGVNCQINNTNGVTLAADVVISGNLVLSSGNLSVSNRTLTLNGSFTPNANFLGVTTSSSLSIGGTGTFGTLTTTGSTTINNFTIDRTSSGSVTLGSSLTIGGTLTQINGDIVLNGRTLTVSGQYSRTNGNINGDASASFIIDGTGTLPTSVAFSGAQTLNTLTLNRATATLTTASSLTLTNLNLLSGTFDNGGTITMNQGGILTRTEGSIINNTPTTNPTSNAYDIVYDIANDISTGSEIPALSTQLRNVTKTGGATLTLTEALIINGTLTLTNGTFNASTFAIDLKGNLIANSTSILTASPFTFSGTTSISGGSIIQFGDVSVTGTLTPTVNIRIDGDLINDGILNAGTGSQTITFGGNTTISGISSHNFNNVTITGTLTAPSTMNIAGNFTFSSGTFNHSAGTVVFNGTTSISGTPQFQHITVASTGTLNGPTNLMLAGDFIVNGTFNAGTGRLTFNGSANQKLDRTSGSAGTINLFNVTVNKASSTFNVQSTVSNTIFRVQNEFTIAQAGSSNPDIDFDGSGTGTLVLGSTSTRTAKITSVPVGTQIVGNLTVERFVQNTDAVRAYRYLASPVVGATVADWQGEIQITGAFSNPSTGAGIPNPNSPSMYRWIETNGGLASNRYSAYPNNISLPASSFPLSNGTGYAVYVRDTGTPTVTSRGTLRFGDVGVSLTSTGSEVDAAGFNLIGNPYPAPIDWDLVTLPGGVSAVISLLDNVSNGGLGGGQFVYYTQGGPQVGNFDGIIGSSQAFWVETSVNTTLTFTEANKASATNPIVVREGRIADVLRINVQGNGRKDETVVYFRSEATDNYDISYDALKRENQFINLFSYKLNEATMDKFAINALNGIGCSREIMLGLEKFEVGTYTFAFSEMDSFNEPYNFTLMDNFTGVSVPIDNQFYEFQVTDNPASKGYDRFKIIISKEDINGALAVAGEQACDAKNLKITLESTQPGISYQPYYNGLAIGDVAIGNGSALIINLQEDALSVGLSEVSVKAFNGCTELFLAQKAPIEVFEVVQATVNSSGNTLTSNYSSGNQWYFDGTEIAGASGQDFEANASGLYTVVVTTAEGCTTSAEHQFVVTDAEKSLEDRINVYPNPVKNKLKIEIESAEPVSVKIFNTMGVEITSRELTDENHTKQAEFDLSNQTYGIYIVRVQRGSDLHQMKIIKTKE